MIFALVFPLTKQPAYLFQEVSGLFNDINIRKFIGVFDDGFTDLVISSLRQQISFGRKRAEQWWACAVAGHSKFCRSMGLCATEVGQIIADLVLAGLWGRGLVRKEAFLLKALWLLCGYKVKALPRPRAGLRQVYQ